jgi:hypothetical protein
MPPIWGSPLGGDEGLLKEESGSIGQAQIIWDGLKVAVNLFLLHGDGFEQKCLSSHVHDDLPYFPMARGDLSAFHAELASLFQVPQETAAELNLVRELAIDADQALLLGVNPDVFAIS